MAFTTKWVRSDAGGSGDGSANNSTDAYTLAQALALSSFTGGGALEFKIVNDGAYTLTADISPVAASDEEPCWWHGVDETGNHFDPDREVIGADSNENGLLDTANMPSITCTSGTRINFGSSHFSTHLNIECNEYVGWYMAQSADGWATMVRKSITANLAGGLPVGADNVLYNCDLESTGTGNLGTHGASGQMFVGNRMKIASTGTGDGFIQPSYRGVYVDNIFIGSGKAEGYAVFDENSYGPGLAMGNTAYGWDKFVTSHNNVIVATPVYIDNLCEEVNEFYYNEYGATGNHTVLYGGNYVDAAISDSNLDIVDLGLGGTISADPFVASGSDNFNIDDGEDAIGDGLLTNRDVGALQRLVEAGTTYDEDVNAQATGTAGATDALVLSESVNAQATGAAGATDTQAMDEAVSAAATGVSSATDAGVFSDSGGAVAAGVCSASDGLVVSESGGAEATGQAGATDAMGGTTESVSAEASGSAGATDVMVMAEPVGAEASGSAGASDTMVMAEVVGDQADGQAGASDTMTMVESVGAEGIGEADAIDQWDGLFETVYATAVGVAGATDVMVMAESVGAEASGICAATEGVVFAESGGAEATCVAAGSDQFTMVENVYAEATCVAAATDVGTFTESVFAEATGVAYAGDYTSVQSAIGLITFLRNKKER